MSVSVLRIWVFLAGVAGLVLLGLGAGAQTLGGGGLIALPLGENDTVIAAEEVERLANERYAAPRPRGTSVTEPGVAAHVLSPLRPLRAQGRAAGSAIRFDGETRHLEFMLYVPDPSIARVLRVATLSSINVLPERSSFQVWVNDTAVGGGRLDNFTQFGAVDLPVGATLLRGQNHVRIELVQYHRIYCGPDASFALWTDIDLATSGVVFDAQDVPPGPEAFLMGLAGAASQGGVEVRGVHMLGDQSEAWVSLITSRLTNVLGGDPLTFRFTDYWSVVGQGRSMARITFLPGTANRVSFRTAGDGAQVMVVEFIPDAAPSGLPDFETHFPLAAPVAQPQMIETQRAVALAEFGARDIAVADRYARIEERFRLPDDFVILTAAKAEFRFTYRYAPDLPRGSALLIHVNGTNVRLLPLRGEGGRLIDDFPVRFQASLLRAGVNTVAFEVMIPGDPADLPCPSRNGPVVELDALSTINVPFSPSMYLPDMQLAFATLGSRSLRLNDMTARAYSTEDITTLSSALILGQSGNASLPATLNLIALEDLGSLPVGSFLISRRAIEDVLLGANALDLPQVAGETGGLLRSAAGRDSAMAMGGVWDWLTRTASEALQWVHPRSGLLLNAWLSEQRGQAILLQLDYTRPDQLWLLRSPTSDIGAIASSIVAARTFGEGPRGQVSVLGLDGQWRSWVAPDRQPVLLEPITGRNLRHVLGNFVSAMPIKYVTGLFFLALVSALFALRLVISTREHET
jgi:hypothetical protein